MTQTATSSLPIPNVLMAMTYQERIRRAGSAQDAMTILGEGIDALLGLSSSSEVTAAEWDDWQAHTTDALPASHSVLLNTNDVAIGVVRKQLETATGEDRLALEARLRLLTDDGVIVPLAVPDGRRTITTGDDKQIVVEIPAPNGPRMQARRELAIDFQLGGQITPLLPIEEAADAYGRGGPMWLYMYDRDAVMGMPVAWRRSMVADVLEDSPAQAHELGRDILKDTEPGENPS